MKYGLQFLQAWSLSNQVPNVSSFLIEAAIGAENAGWDGFFLWDHLYFSWIPVAMPDSWSILSAIAARTSKIRLGTNVTAVTRRRPQVLAKQLVTVDQISNGRVILGAGLGGSGEGKGPGEEFTSFNEASNYNVLARIADEALEIITGLWSGEKLNYNGKFHKVRNVIFLPTPIQKPRIPIWIGAIKTPALKRAARYDGWITQGPCSSVEDPGLSFKQVNNKMKLIKSYRNNNEPFDLVYALEFPKKDIKNLKVRAEAINVTWMLDVISGLRFSNREEVMTYIKHGPPK